MGLLAEPGTQKVIFNFQISYVIFLELEHRKREATTTLRRKPGEFKAKSAREQLPNGPSASPLRPPVSPSHGSQSKDHFNPFSDLRWLADILRMQVKILMMVHKSLHASPILSPFSSLSAPHTDWIQLLLSHKAYHL